MIDQLVKKIISKLIDYKNKCPKYFTFKVYCRDLCLGDNLMYVTRKTLNLHSILQNLNLFLSCPQVLLR